MSFMRGSRLATGSVLVMASAVLSTSGLPASAAPAPHHPRPAPTGADAATLTAATLTAATLTVSGPAGTVRHGTSLAFAGRLSANGSFVPAAMVELQRHPRGGDWSAVAVASTAADGSVRFSRTATGTARWRLRHQDDGVTAEATSTVVDVPVRAALMSTWTRNDVRLGRAATVRGTVSPARGAVRLQRRSGGSWHRIGVLAVHADGSFRRRVRPGAAGFQRYRVVRRPGAAVLGATRVLPRLDVYRLHTYVVRTRGAVKADVARFAASAAASYADPRGWSRAHHRFRRVRSGGAFTLLLAEARYLPTYSSVCSVRYSCRVGRFVIVNDTRWRRSSPFLTGNRATYRAMVVNHETGHWMGRPHAYCSRPGRPAPVMQQQSKGMQGCRPNAWPLRREIRAVS